jgi:hypothetical protein
MLVFFVALYALVTWIMVWLLRRQHPLEHEVTT